MAKSIHQKIRPGRRAASVAAALLLLASAAGQEKNLSAAETEAAEYSPGISGAETQVTEFSPGLGTIITEARRSFAEKEALFAAVSAGRAVSGVLADSSLAEALKAFGSDALALTRSAWEEEIAAASSFAMPDPVLLRKTLSRLRLKYGRSVTFAFRFPESSSPSPGAENTSYHGFSDYYVIPGMTVQTRPSSMVVLRLRLQEMIRDYSGTWSVYVKNLDDNQQLVINDAGMPSASLMKLFVMGTVYQSIADGQLARTDEILARLSSMISYSSNEDTNALLKILGNGSYEDGIAQVNEYIISHRYSDNTREYNGFQDSSTIFSPDHTNQVTAADCGRLLERIYHRTFASRKICNEVENWMLNQHTRYKIPAGIDSGVQIGNKTGETDSIENDAAIVYADQCDYIICVLSCNWDSKDEAQKHIQQISREVYSCMTDPQYVGKHYHPVG